MMSAFAFIDEAHSTLAQNSTRAVYAAALVLTLAMLSFCVDLAQAPGRQARAGRRGAADDAAVIGKHGDRHFSLFQGFADNRRKLPRIPGDDRADDDDGPDEQNESPFE